MECPAETSSTQMIYKIINTIPTFFIIVPVQYLPEIGRRLVLRNVVDFLPVGCRYMQWQQQPNVGTASAASAVTTATVQQPLGTVPLLGDVCSRFLPTQFIRSTGSSCTLYSRCSLAMVHKVRFFSITSSSLLRKFLSQSRYQRREQSHTSGLSEKHQSDQIQEDNAVGKRSVWGNQKFVQHFSQIS